VLVDADASDPCIGGSDEVQASDEDEPVLCDVTYEDHDEK
jgi:hypothetical protein